MKINDKHIGKIIRESINKILYEGIDGIEDVPAFEVINDNISLTEIQDTLQSYLYDENDNCVGRLCDLHFKYDANNDRMLGGRSI